MSKNKLTVSFEDVINYDDKSEILLSIKKLDTINFDIPNYVSSGDTVAVIDSDGFYGIIPKLEYSAYHNSFKSNIKNKPIKAMILAKYNIDGKKVVIFSSKKYELLEREPFLDELKNSDYVEATIIGFNEYSAILKYKKLHMQLSNADFSDNGDVAVSDILNINDKINVVFSKLKKRGRIIKVKPQLPFPKPDYLKLIDRSKLAEDMILDGKIIKTSPRNILIIIGKNVGVKIGNKVSKKNNIILTSALHPDPIIDEYMVEGMHVQVKITKINEDFIFSKIISVNINNVDDNIMKYHQSIQGEK